MYREKKKGVHSFRLLKTYLSRQTKIYSELQENKDLLYIIKDP